VKGYAVLAIFVPAVALAHGGDAPPAPKVATVPGRAIYFPKESQFLLGVRTEPIATRTIETRLTVPGKIVPRTDRFAQVFPPVAGRVAAAGGRLPLVGERVKRGQVLAVVQQSLSATEGTQLEAERIRAEAAAAAARAELEQARRDLERQRALRGVVAEREIQKAELAVEVARGEAERTARARELFAGGKPGGGGRPGRFELTAPLDGVLTAAQATVGELVDPAKPLFAVLDPQVVWVEASVFADDVGQVEAARDALVQVDGYPERWFSARLFNLGQVVDEASRTVKVIFELPNDDGKLRPGTFARVAIGAGGKREVLAVPDAAVIERDGRTLVYVHGAPEEFFAREVALGARDGAYHALRQGLVKGERVVVRGTYSIRAAEGR
jgi:membrane fusion protein, heavy metal efflux system